MYNLLLVDDEPLIKVAFQSAVEWGKNGFLLAATASNGQEALHIVETQHIDAVITDLKMPGMDGLALIHELKKRSFTGPILVLSNYSDFDSVRTALTDGAYDYFLKINMNGESIGEHLEKMADLLRVQQQRQTEEDHRSFAIEAQKKENALCADAGGTFNRKAVFISVV
jgi:two-component system, response regulator YesN